MEDQRFDGITRAFASGMSRRGGIAAMVAGVLGAAGVTAAAANPGRRHEKLACRNANSECTSDDQCCSGSCVPKPEGGTGFRCAKRHKKSKKNKGGGGGSTGALVPLGEPCQQGVDTCEDGGTCRQYPPMAQTNLVRFGAYCTSDTGTPCPGTKGSPPETWMGYTCEGGFCAYRDGDAAGPGVCGEWQEVTNCLGNGACNSDNMYANYNLQIPSTCAYVNSAYGQITDWGQAGACTQDSDCQSDQFCISTSSVGSNPCNVAYFAGYCVMEGRYACTTTADCPARSGWNVSSCASWNGSLTNFCYYSNS